MRFRTLARTPKIIAIAAGTALLAASLGASAATTAAAAPITGLHTWQVTTVEGVSDWSSVASSSDGTRLVATEIVRAAGDPTNPDGTRTQGCAIWISPNGGQGWVEETTIPGEVGLCQVVSSGDGVHLVATVNDETNGQLVVTSSDSGETWTEHPTALPQGWWIDMTMSKDGSHVWVVPGYAQSYIHESDDYGVTWHQDETPGLEYRSIASSADGTKLIAYQSSGIVTSSDGGASWTSNFDSGQMGTYGDLSTSATGQYSMLAGYSFLNSDDYGQTWTPQNVGSPNGGLFEATAMSADGQIQVAQSGCTLSTSTDAGVTWASQSLGTTCANWSHIAMSDDGTRFIASSQDGQGLDQLFVGTIAAATESDKYVALGDSFQSGEGAYDYDPATNIPNQDMCHRSANAYPNLLANSQEVALTLDFRACSGAEITDVVHTNQTNKTEGPQIDALGNDTRLVTIGISGNDLGFGDTVHNCIEYINGLESLAGPLAHWFLTCAGQLGSGVQAKITSLQSGTIHKNLVSLYRLIRAKAPHARIIVVSYPQFFPAGGVAGFAGVAGCSTLRVSDQVWMNSMIREADAAIDTAAVGAGLEVSDMSTTMAGHEQCTASPALNGIVGLTAPEDFHPNAYGHLLMADQLERLIAAPLEPTFTIKPQQTVTRTFVVSGSTFHVNVAWPGSDVETTLISPSGKVYSRANPLDATHDNGATYEYYDVPNPEPGTWTVSSYGLDVAAAGEPVTLSALNETAPNVPPTAVVKVSGAGPTYTFDASASADSDGSIAGYEWDFGDGTTSTGAVAQHTYTTSGTYLATLVTTDNDGDQGFGNATTNVVIPGQNVAVFSGSSTSLRSSFASLGANSTAYIAGNFRCDSNVHIQGSVIVTGDATLTNRCTIDGNLTAGGDVRDDSKASIGGNLVASGNIRFRSTAHVGGYVVSGKTFSSADGLTIAAIESKGSVGGTISSHVSVPGIAPAVLPAVVVNSPVWTGFSQETWRAWVNATAKANGAPRTSQGLSARPGCTMSAARDSVNGSSVSISTDTVIDATNAASGCSGVSLQGMTLTLSADLVIYADSFSSIRGLTVKSGDGLPHLLRILIPGKGAACRSGHTIDLSGGTSIDPLIGTRLFAPGTVTLSGVVSFSGEVQAGRLRQRGATSITYASIPTPGLDH